MAVLPAREKGEGEGPSASDNARCQLSPGKKMKIKRQGVVGGFVPLGLASQAQRRSEGRGKAGGSWGQPLQKVQSYLLSRHAGRQKIAEVVLLRLVLEGVIALL